MKTLYSILLISLTLLTSCAYLTKKVVYKDQVNNLEAVEYTGFWDNSILVTAYGFTMATPYGPFNLGYIQYQWNIENPKDPSKPSDALRLIPIFPK